MAKHRPYTPAHRGARLAHDLGSIPSVPTKYGRLAEWLMALVLKTSDS